MSSRVDDDDNDANVTIAERAPNDIKGNAISSIFFKKTSGPSSASFSFIFVFSNKHYNSHNE